LRLSKTKIHFWGRAYPWRLSVRTPHQLIGGLAAAGGAAVTIYLLISLLVGESVPLFAQLNHLTHWITLGCGASFVLALFLRPARPYAPLFLTGVGAFVAWYGADFLPKPMPIIQGVEITAMTFNTEGRNTDPDDLLDIIRARDADVVALQEVFPEMRWRIRTELIEEYPYQVMQVGPDIETIVLLSRYPILDMPERHPLTNWPRPNRFLRAVLDVDGQQVVVYNFHPARPRFKLGLTYTDAKTEENTRGVLDSVKNESLPVLVLCDCNASPRTDSYGWMSKQLIDSHGESGWGLGLTQAGLPDLPNWWPNMRIDYIWHGVGVTAVDSRVGSDSGGSDHWPVWARLVLIL
jgi:vancomycin resistance protein VanJ